ncbi:MAG TPA: AMP-binding protein, partial [Chondromyces sp.]|nr:AMP-binding protein [Chondromyces sp.]
MDTINDVLQTAVAQSPDKPFLHEGYKRMTYKELDEMTDRLASAFLNIGLKKGDHIAILAINQLEWLMTYFAAAKIGVGIVALNVRYRDTELDYMINHSNVKALISINQHSGFNFSEFFNKFQPKIPSVEKYIFIGEGFRGSLEFSELLQESPDHSKLKTAKEKVKPEDLAIMIYTSGTTGKPKGVMITHRSILASGRAQAKHFEVAEDDIIIAGLPFNHVGGITCSIT